MLSSDIADEWRSRTIDENHDEEAWKAYLNNETWGIYAYQKKEDGWMVPVKSPVRYVVMAGWVSYGRLPPGLNVESMPLERLRESRLRKLEYTTSGHLVLPSQPIGWKVDLRSDVIFNLDALAGDYYHSCMEDRVTSSSRGDNVGPYRKRMMMAGLTTECLSDPSRVPLCEGFYPFDFTDANLEVVAADPKAVNAEFERLEPWIVPNSTSLFVVATNSD